MRIHSTQQRTCWFLVFFCLFNLIFGSFVATQNVTNAQAATLPPITEFPLPNSDSYLYHITSSPDGNLWFTESNGNKIGRITPSGALTEFPIPSSSSGPQGITADLDGNIWFTEEAGRIGKFTPNEVITEFNLSAIHWPESIALGSDKNLWFTDQANDFAEIGRITPSGTVTYFQTPTSMSYPRGITAGPDGNLWFTEYTGNKIGRITPSGTITEFSVPTLGSLPLGITSGPDGNLWFTEYTGNRIGRITPSGTITEFPIPTLGSSSGAITSGPDGNLWFAEYVGNKIGRITPSGTITEFPIPTLRKGFDSITSGPDGNLWLTEFVGNRIARVNISRSTTPTPPTPSPISMTITQIISLIQDSVSASDAACNIITCTPLIAVPVDFLSRLFTISDLGQASIQTVILGQKLAALNQAIKQYGLHSSMTCLAAQATFEANRNLHSTLISLVPLMSILSPLPVGESPACR